MAIKGEKVLVTGGSGFIGSHLCRRLVAEGADVYVMIKYNSVMDNVRLVDLWGRITPVEADLRNPDSLRQIKEIKPQIVYHLAAYNHVGDSFFQCVAGSRVKRAPVSVLLTGGRGFTGIWGRSRPTPVAEPWNGIGGYSALSGGQGSA